MLWHLIQEKWSLTQVTLLLTCDQASPFFFFRGGKVRLIQLLDYSSVASPESRLFFSDWSRNKGHLELSLCGSVTSGQRNPSS